MLFKNKKNLLAVALSGTLLVGCASSLATTATALIVGENVGRMTAMSKFKPYDSFVSEHLVIAETDIREQLSSITDANLSKLVQSGEAIQILPDGQGFKAFTKQDFSDFRLKRLRVNKLNAAVTDYYTFITLALHDQDLQNIAAIAKRYQHIVMIRGLKNGSIEETLAKAKILTDKGVTVLIAPALMQKLNAKYAPTFAQINVQPDGSYGCTEQETKCKPATGHIGFIPKPLFGNIGGN